jgi:hypothetical protein
MLKDDFIRKWLEERNLTIVREIKRNPTWLRKGSITTTYDSCAIFVPLPFEPCHVEKQENNDPGTAKKVDWEGTVFLPPNSALILKEGTIKFIVYILQVGARPAS